MVENILFRGTNSFIAYINVMDYQPVDGANFAMFTCVYPNSDNSGYELSTPSNDYHTNPKDFTVNGIRLTYAYPSTPLTITPNKDMLMNLNGTVVQLTANTPYNTGIAIWVFERRLIAQMVFY